MIYIQVCHLRTYDRYDRIKVYVCEGIVERHIDYMTELRCASANLSYIDRVKRRMHRRSREYGLHLRT